MRTRLFLRFPASIARQSIVRLSGRRQVLGVLVLVVATIAAGCQTVPMSGRRRPMLLTSETSEITMGTQAYTELMAGETPSTNAEAAAMVQRVGERIAAVSGRDDFQWEFRLIAGDTVNAFCLPGGKVAIYEGILPVCQSEAGLAVVMSHEVAHALARHGGERMNHDAIKNGLAKAGSLGLSKAAPGLDAGKKQLISQAYGVASQYGVILPYSRKHESEADAIGLTLMAKAGYDPSEAPHFWERFSSSTGNDKPEFFSTHPSDARRAAALREQLPEALAAYRAAGSQHGLGDAVPGVALGPAADPQKTADASPQPSDIQQVSHETPAE